MPAAPAKWTAVFRAEERAAAGGREGVTGPPQMVLFESSLSGHLLVQKYLLISTKGLAYWYKSANTESCCACLSISQGGRRLFFLVSLYLFFVSLYLWRPPPFFFPTMLLA